MPLLLFSLEQNGIDEKKLHRACNLVGVSPKKENISTWIDATKKYLLSWHPEGIVKEAIALKSK